MAFEDDTYCEQDAFEGVEENGEVFPVRWKPIADFSGDDADLLYPEGVLTAVTTAFDG